MKNKQNKILFVVRQYVWAKDAPSAIKISKKSSAHEVWVDEDFRKRMSDPKDCMGFDAPEES